MLFVILLILFIFTKKITNFSVGEKKKGEKTMNSKEVKNKRKKKIF